MYSITRNGSPLDPSKYTLDISAKIFSTKEDGLVLDFGGDYAWTFSAGHYCSFKTGSSCAFVTGNYCIFDVGDNGTFTTGYGCTFTTHSSGVFTTGSDCTFSTWWNCTFTIEKNFKSIVCKGKSILHLLNAEDFEFGGKDNYKVMTDRFKLLIEDEEELTAAK